MSTEAPPQRIAIAAARNEADRVGHTLDALAAALPGAALWVADDASGDGTAEIAMAHGAQVVSRRKPHGKGANVTAAAEAALFSIEGDPVVLLCDADLGGSAGELAALAEAVERGDCDLAVAAFVKREGGGFGFALGYARSRIERLSGFTAEAGQCRSGIANWSSKRKNTPCQGFQASKRYTSRRAVRTIWQGIRTNALTNVLNSIRNTRCFSSRCRS